MLSRKTVSGGGWVEAVPMAVARANGGIDWPRLVLGVLAQAEPVALPSGALGWNLVANRSRAAPQRRYGGGLHRHERTELCVTVRGRGVMELEDRRYRMAHPAMVLLPPGVLHGEGFDPQQHAYATVWFTCSGEGQRVFANAYDPLEGWSCPWWAMLPGRDRGRLSRWFLESPPVDAGGFEQFRATLLAAVGELARDAAVRGRRGGRQAASGHLRVLRWVRHYLDQHYAQPLTVREVAAMTRYSPHYLDSLFTQWCGRGIRGYLIDVRMQSALRLCTQTELPIGEVAARVGYGDPLYFSRAFRRYYGRTPSAARREGGLG